MTRNDRTAGFVARLEALGDAQPLMLADIIRATAYAAGLTRAELTGALRYRTIVHARQAAMWIAQRGTRRSYPEIGRAFGGRDHTTVLFGVRQVTTRLARGDEGCAHLIDDILDALVLRPPFRFDADQRATPLQTLFQARPERSAKIAAPDVGDFTAPVGSRPWFTANERRFQAGFVAAHPELVSESLRDSSGGGELSISFVGAS